MPLPDITFEVRGLEISTDGQNGPPKRIVQQIDFQVPKGKVVALIGESGAGKTTIAMSALGYCRPGLVFSGGEALLGDIDVLKASTDTLRGIRGKRVTYLAQSAAANFNPSLRLGDQVTEAAVRAKLATRAELEERMLELYRALDLPDPEGIGMRYPHQVSGGQLQRVMAAMALVSNPELLILDEPTTALDVTTQIEVLQSFKKAINQQGTSAIYVTHDLAVVSQIADYIVVLYQGEIQEMGPTEMVLGRTGHAYTRRLLSALRPSPKPEAERGPDRERDQQAATKLSVQSVSAGYGPRNRVDNVPATSVLKDVTLTMAAGKSIGVIGESGSGKSTLARVIAGLLAPYEGSIALEGSPVAPEFRHRSKSDLRKLQFVYQSADTALNPKQTVAQIVGRPLEKFLGLKGAWKRERLTELLQQVDLDPKLASRLPGELSGGQKQRVNLARALASEPEIILCDEVTSALDTVVGASIIELLKRLRKETGVSTIFISHDLSTVASFTDMILVMYKGKVVEFGSVRDVLSPPFHPYTRLLITSVPEIERGWLERRVEERGMPIGEIGDSVDLNQETGCLFHPRCDSAIAGICDVESPPVQSFGTEKDHRILCHLGFAKASLNQQENPHDTHHA